ncbi:hypothetical protein BC941DRAFT_434146 [Chlamydoabsidia padenii]|nr:hypothetical protein BC941DRAFT_434146 [Chlamydoabsidia padenii]
MSSTLMFESGVMKIQDYDPIHGRYETRTLQLPSLPLFDQLDLSVFDSTFHEDSNTTCTKNSHLSRFIECFEEPSTTIKSSASLRSRKSTSAKKTVKSPRRCYSNPNMSKKSRKVDSMILPTNAPKRSLSNAFQVLSGLLPIKNKRRLDADDRRISTSSTLEQVWQSMTYLDEIKTSMDHGMRPSPSRSQTKPWWLNPTDVCVKS